MQGLTCVVGLFDMLHGKLHLIITNFKHIRVLMIINYAHIYIDYV